MTRLLLPIAAAFLILLTSSTRAGLPPAAGTLNRILVEADDWFKSDEGKAAALRIVSWQNANGGWWKKYDPSTMRPTTLPAPDPHDAPPGDTEEVWRHTSTFDNGATYTELRIIARAARLTDNDS